MAIVKVDNEHGPLLPVQGKGAVEQGVEGDASLWWRIG